MILSDRVAAGVASGEIDLAFRRWTKTRVTAEHRFHSVAGIISVVDIQEISAASITAADAKRAGYTTVAAVMASLRGNPTNPLFRIHLVWEGADPRIALADAAKVPDDELAQITKTLDRLDARSSHGPWTREILRLIQQHPGRRAADIAVALGRDKERVKLDVRKLKNLGLTRSLTIGYEISPRGHAYLTHE